MPNELTNPNNVVTEERLAQFYQQILPYLGGMPDVLANKFNRADLYSTDEKLIGRWIDGKPLYEKVIIQTDYNINSSWKYVSTGIVNLGEVVELKGTFAKSESGTDIYSLSYGGGDAFISLVIDKSNYKIAIKSGESRTGKLVVVIKYTKTTDSAVEIGDDTDYSTTEKIVGTWIDGKPIWQKTVVIDALSKTGNQVDYNHEIAGIDLILTYDMTFINPSTGQSGKVNSSSSSTYVLSCIEVTRSTIAYQVGTAWSFTKGLCTLQYTKTSS